MYLTQKMEALGFDVIEDDSEERSGHGAGNLIASMKGTVDGADAIYFTCHMDTVVPGLGIKPELRDDGYVYSDGTTILGADDKAGIAALFEMIRTVKETEYPTWGYSICHYGGRRKWACRCERNGSFAYYSQIWLCSRQ